MDFTTELIQGRAMISHLEIARLFQLPAPTIQACFQAFKLLDGQNDTVLIDGDTYWVDDVAFFELYCELDLPEALGQAVLTALGHFRTVEAA